jgi:hypothetical protein
LLTKACKTFKSIQVLCERGLHEDADALVRVLLETTAAILYILREKSTERALIYHAHGMHQQLKMLKHWRGADACAVSSLDAVSHARSTRGGHSRIGVVTIRSVGSRLRRALSSAGFIRITGT